MILKKIVKVLIVEDSKSVQDLLAHILTSDPQIEIIGIAGNGKVAIDLIQKNKPDVITMDMDMPVMNGLETTKVIMGTVPIPIIIVTASWSPSDVRKTYNALDAGAVSIMNKPSGIGHPEHNAIALELIRTVKAMSEVKLVRRRASLPTISPSPTLKFIKSIGGNTEIEIVVIGASTGGPAVIQQILALIPRDLPVPILIVQHISKGFLDGFINWLILSTGHKIHIASHTEKAEPGHIYVAPDNFHMGISAQGIIELEKNISADIFCPSVSHLFISAARNFDAKAMGILLTGMGNDGAAELLMMKEKGALTIAQDEKSSVVYGMPGIAARLGAAKYILSPTEIAETLVQNLKKKTSGKSLK